MTVYRPGVGRFVRYADEKGPLNDYMLSTPKGVRVTFVLHTWNGGAWQYVGTRRNK